MATTSTREGFLRLLREDTEFKEEVRRIILTDELLRMPARADRIEHTLVLIGDTLAMVVKAMSRASGAQVYVAVEASYVIDDGDVERAHRTTGVLAKVFPNVEVSSVVYGTSINSAGSAAAERLGVSVYDSARSARQIPA